MQIKTQLRVELDQTDINEALRDYLAKHGTKVTSEELGNIKYTNTIKDGLKAVLDVKDETNVGEPAKEVRFEAEKEVNESVSKSVDIDTSELHQEEEEEESAKEDVFPSIDDVAEAITKPAAQEEDEEALVSAEAVVPRKSLFNT